MRLLIEIPTKDRDVVLGRCLAALLNQSYQDFDVLILNDGSKPVGRTQTTGFFIDELRQNREVRIQRGSRISQAHNHNIALYSPEFREYGYILRLDDDILLSSFALGYMVYTLDQEGVDAVGGLWFENEWVNEEIHDRAVIEWQLETFGGTDGKVDDVNNNLQQRMYHPTDELYKVEHIYGACLYDAEAMRMAGGWPEVYSKGVAHGEETDGTYRLHLYGNRLYIDPMVTGQHLKSPGGIRADENIGLRQVMDNAKWRERWHKFEDIDFEPKVAIWCQHQSGIGGAQKLFYQTVRALQDRMMDVYPILHGAYTSPKECQDLFGFTYEIPDEYPDRFDVCLVMAHEPSRPVEADHYILYTFFPDDTENTFEDFDLILGISKFVSHWIGEKWGYEAGYVYPMVPEIGLGDGPKENIILIVSRGDPHKAPLWLMERFADFELEGWELHVVLARVGYGYTSYEDQIRDMAKGHDNIFLYENIPDKELHVLYRRAKILWCANGLYAENNPKLAEHFGLTPVEACTAGCVPVAYDLGGHRETVSDDLRWRTPDELLEITLMAGRSSSLPAIGVDPKIYAYHLDNWIRRVNAMTLELQHVERIEVKEQKIRLAWISDSPLMPEYNIGLTTGFGVVSGQICKAFIEQPDIDLFVLGILDVKYPENVRDLPFHYMPTAKYDIEGKADRLIEFFEWAKPDVIGTLYDPGRSNSVLFRAQIVGLSDVPSIAYFPVEGRGRANRAVVELVKQATFPVTYCINGAELIEKAMPDAQVLVALHGADHAKFVPLPTERRQKLRELVGWKDRFVIMNAGSNKRVKQQPILIEAMKILLQRGHGDILLYLHTRSFDSHIMSGWDLNWIIQHDERESEIPLGKHILFPAALDKWKGPAYEMSEIEEWRMTMPPEPKMRAMVFNSLDFITRYCLASLYVDVSSAEGWGLPVLEAAACGVPTLSVDDGMARSEIHSRYCHMLEPRFTWDTWRTGTRLSLVHPEDVANAIEELKMNPDFRYKYEDEQKHLLTDLPWKNTTDLFVDLARKAYALSQKAR